MKRDKLETAKKLAKAHFGVEPNLKSIHLIEPFNAQDPSDPIKLLEVVEGTIERGIEPIGFTADPARGIEYPSIIVEVSPAEYETFLRDGKLGYLDWSIGTELTA
jgi:hypothetical protein